VAATRNDRAGCADPAACVALLDTLDVADVARPTLPRQGRRRVQKPPRSRQKMYYHTYTKFASNHNSQLFMLYGRLVHVGETFNRSELHKNAFGGWAGLGMGLECGCVGWSSTSHGQLHCDTGTSYVPAWPRQNANVLSKTLAATKLNR